EFLEPGDNPEVEFNLNIPEDSTLKVREYCNIHGLWHS
ncbi:MAG: desulfoferrodoxin, partial [Methanobacterium sp.]|nr:desulfoferrodoxin [Methanobacterium sp.]